MHSAFHWREERVERAEIAAKVVKRQQYNNKQRLERKQEKFLRITHAVELMIQRLKERPSSYADLCEVSGMNAGWVERWVREHRLHTKNIHIADWAPGVRGQMRVMLFGWGGERDEKPKLKPKSQRRDGPSDRQIRRDANEAAICAVLNKGPATYAEIVEATGLSYSWVREWIQARRVGLRTIRIYDWAPGVPGRNSVRRFAWGSEPDARGDKAIEKKPKKLPEQGIVAI